MTQRDYEYGRKLILSRLKSAQRLLGKTRPEQAHEREKLAARIGAERAELAKWEAVYQAEAEELPATPVLDTPHFEEPARQMHVAA